ncbi:MAG TPA: hypothetical protein VKE74_29920 [Gemmataceae bacterium]|nr:hypothetical protein [Gemmataceae bacterium]
MFLAPWLRRRLSSAAGRQGRDRVKSAAFRPRLESLEGRTVPTTIVLTVNTVSDGNVSGKYLTLRDAITVADNHADKTYEIDITVPGKIQLQSSLPELKNNITIKGAGPGQTLLKRDAQAAAFRALTVDAGWTVALSDIDITLGNAGRGNGGAIDNRGNLTLTDCHLYANSAANGGAVENEKGASLTSIGATFTGNTATNGGGAIDNAGTLSASGGAFTNNSAHAGGAIANFGTATVSQSEFGDGTWTGSNVAVDGGAIMNSSAATLALGAGANFNDNLAAYDGGAIDNQGTVTASGGSFTNNSAQDGGAIYNHFDATVSGCTFDSNRSTGTSIIGNGGSPDGGGAIWSDWSLTVQGNCNFLRNTAAYVGGAIDADNSGSAATVTVSQSAFSSNSASYGGAIANSLGTTLSLNAGNTFTGNHASEGGAITNLGTLSTIGASFKGNHAERNGGAIVSEGAATFTSCEFIGNTASAGGAVFNRNGAMTLSGCQLLFNQADEGGAILNTAGVLNVVSGCDVEQNGSPTAGGRGGGIYTTSSSINGVGVTNIAGSIVRNNGVDDTFTVTSSGAVLNLDATSIVPHKTTL